MEKWYRGSRIHMAFQHLKQLYSLQEKCRLKLLKVGNWTPHWAVIFHPPHWQNLGSLITQHTTLARLCRNRLSKTSLVEVWIATPPLEGHLAPLIKTTKAYAHWHLKQFHLASWHSLGILRKRKFHRRIHHKLVYTRLFITNLFTLVNDQKWPRCSAVEDQLNVVFSVLTRKFCVAVNKGRKGGEAEGGSGGVVVGGTSGRMLCAHVVTGRGPRALSFGKKSKMPTRVMPTDLHTRRGERRYSVFMHWKKKLIVLPKDWWTFSDSVSVVQGGRVVIQSVVGRDFSVSLIIRLFDVLNM